MPLLLSALIILTCILLILMVLIQNPKGGGLSSSFGGSGTQLFGGVKKTTDFLDKGTWALAIALVFLVLTANVMISPTSGTGTQDVQESSVLEETSSAPVLSLPAADEEIQGIPENVEETEAAE